MSTRRSTRMSDPAAAVCRWLGLVFLLLSLCCAQEQAFQHTFQASRTDVESALRAIRAQSGGKLPVLEGFAAETSEAARYRRPYYQFSIETSAINSSETLVRVHASITAWYEDDNPSQSGYRSLASNGRLESDLFDRIEEALPRGAAKTAPTPEKSAHAAKSARPFEKPAEASAGRGVHDNSALPDAASAAKIAATLRAPSVAPSAPPTVQNGPAAGIQQTAIRRQELEQQARNLQEILEHQSKPQDLAVVKNARTPVLSRPMPDARVLMLAEAEDEFQVIEAQNDWIHVQLTGLEGGWVQREQLDLSHVSPRLLAPQGRPTLSSAQTFQQTREETGTFPGQWQALRGKKVKIIWVEASDSHQDSTLMQRANFARSVFRKTYPELSRSNDRVEGVVIVFDAADGGMAAATVADLRRLNAGELSENAFWKQCWLDPPEAFQKSSSQ